MDAYDKSGILLRKRQPSLKAQRDYTRAWQEDNTLHTSRKFSPETSLAMP